MSNAASKYATLALATIVLPWTGAFAGGVAEPSTGLAPEFARWPVPIYASHVTRTMTYAARSYAVDTTDSVATVVGWYRAKLKGRATLIHGHVTQIAVDNGNYIINFLKTAKNGADINVIKN